MPLHYGTDSIYDTIFASTGDENKVDYDNPREINGSNLGHGNFVKNMMKHFKKRRRSKK